MSGPAAFAMAGIKPSDVDLLMGYDSFTITALLHLEDLGFCAKGEGGAFVADGKLGPGGSFPMNTNGGGLSYTHPGQYGMFLLVEAVRQLRGECGERQVAGRRTSRSRTAPAVCCRRWRRSCSARRRHVMKIIEPPVSDAAAPFWEATRTRRVRAAVVRRRARVRCGTRATCARRASDRRSSGAPASGRRHRVRRRASTTCPAPGREPDDLPYAVALIDLPEGVRMMSNVVDTDVTIGHGRDAVRVTWQPLSDGRNLPLFEPA